MKFSLFCDFVTNGINAYELVKSQDCSFILVNTQMPGMNGATLVHWIQQHFDGRG